MTREEDTNMLNEQVEVENTDLKQMAEVIMHQQTIGSLLKSKREEKGLNLKTISQQTKIHMGLLEHLENDDLAKLPSKTYVRGFVKSAAKILGINQDEALEILEATYNRDDKAVKKPVAPSYEMRNEVAKNTLSAVTATPLETVKSVTASSSAFLAKAAVALIIVGVIGFNIKNLIDRSAEEKLKLPQVLSTIHQKIRPTQKPAAPKVEVKTEEATATPAEPIQVNIIQDKKDTPAKTEMTINDVTMKNISLGEKQFTEDTTLSKEEMDEFLPAKYRFTPAKGVENVFINATEGDSWVTYKVDDKDIKKFVLRQGRTLFLRGEKIRLFIGNTKSLKVFHNNKVITFNTKGGSVKNVVFPEELKTKYMSPLFVFQKDGTVLTSEDYIKQNQKQPEVTMPGSSTKAATPTAAQPAQR